MNLKNIDYVTIHTKTGVEAKDYSHFQSVVDRLDYKVVQIGGKNDPLLNNVVDLRGKTTYNESAYIIKYAKCHIGCDSVPGHIAAAVKTPCVILFGATWSSSCAPKENGTKVIALNPPHRGKVQPCEKPCHYEVCNNVSKRCTDHIKPQTVLDAIASIIGGEYILPEKELTISTYAIIRNGINLDFPIKEVIDSHLAYADEFVLVDGYSDDGTWELLQELQGERPKLKLFQNEWVKKADLMGEQKTFARRQCTGDWLVQTDCLTGSRCVPVKIDGKISIMSLEDIFQHYLNLDYKVKLNNNKEIIEVDNLETLSAVAIKYSEHSLYKHEKGKVLSNYFKNQLKSDYKSLVNNFEKGETLCSSELSSAEISRVKYARNHIKNMKNTQAVWSKVKYITRSKTDKNIIRVSQKYGETECTSDHRVAIQSDNLDFKPVDNFDNLDKLVRINEIINDDSNLGSISLIDWIRDSSLYLDGDKIRYRSKKISQREKFIKNNLSGLELENFCELLGFFVAEGSIERQQLKDWRISQKTSVNNESPHQILSRYHKYLLDISNHQSNFGDYYIGITSPVIIRLFADLCGIGADNKKVPRFIFHLKDNFKLSFLRGYNIGDGNITPYNTNRSETVSQQLHGGICLLMNQLGMKYTCMSREPEGFYDDSNHQRSYAVLQNISKEYNTKFKTKKTDLGKTNDYVYDLTVPKYHNFCDANGLIVVHNCDEIMLPWSAPSVRRVIEDNTNEVILDLPCFTSHQAPNGLSKVENHWKWRISPNKDFIEHGVAKKFRQYDEDGNLFFDRKLSDSCEYLDNRTGEILLGPVLWDRRLYVLGQAYNSGRLTLDSDAGRLFKDILTKNFYTNEMPSVLHLSWLNHARKIKMDKEFWKDVPRYHQGEGGKLQRKTTGKWIDVENESIDDEAVVATAAKLDQEKEIEILEEIKYPRFLKSYISKYFNDPEQYLLSESEEAELMAGTHNFQKMDVNNKG